MLPVSLVQASTTVRRICNVLLGSAHAGVLAEDGVYGVKTSPYIVREQGPLVTAWTLLMSMKTGQPLLLCDAGELTTARTAATTAVAVDALAPLNATRLAIIGSGKVAQAHLHYVRGLRDWQSISLYSPNLADDAETIALLKAIEPRVNIASSRETAVADADVIMLCTSSAGPVIDPAELSKPALITSISTNAPRAHEVPPHSLKDMQVIWRQEPKVSGKGHYGHRIAFGPHSDDMAAEAQLRAARQPAQGLGEHRGAHRHVLVPGLVGRGTPRGASRPCHWVTVKFGTPASVMVGTSGAAFMRVVLATASARSFCE